jgi:hypothetical protein
LLNPRKSLRREKSTAGLLEDLITLSGEIVVSGKIASGREVLLKLFARNAKLNARFLSGPAEAGQCTAKSVLASVKIEKELLLEKTAVSAGGGSRLSASAAETAPNDFIFQLIWKSQGLQAKGENK